jgi:mRNA-degrading endonuclease toxin of MazEF toxin-antitoxin module
LIPAAGEVWLADRGDERRRLVFVVSDDRFQRLAERAVVAPVLDVQPERPSPWHVPLGERTIAVNQLATVSVERLLERVDVTHTGVLRRVRHAVRAIAG